MNWLSDVIGGFGSSPRVRGKYLVQGHVECVRGLIPARAGKIATRSPGCTHPGAHPRACGENMNIDTQEKFVWGSSPRVRGKSERGHPVSDDARLIPARAGKIGGSGRDRRRRRAHPRACGENDLRRIHASLTEGSSPRVRGKSQFIVTTKDFFGLIPARAGKIVYTPAGIFITSAHPRACGENGSACVH